MLKHNYNYGPFSKAMFGDQYRLLNNPDEVATEGWLAIASAFWFYTTPQNPKPSMHDVVTGFWKPNNGDLNRGINFGFGATINIIADDECNFLSGKASNRVRYYQNLMNYFQVPIDGKEVIHCQQMQ